MAPTERQEKLKLLIFGVYDRGNVTTEEASEILDMEVGEFVEQFEAWQNIE